MRLADIIGCMVWVAAFLAATALVPVAGLFTGLLTPLPFIYYLFGLPTRYALQLVGIVIGTLFLLSLLVGAQRLGLFCLEFGVLGFVVAWALQNRLSIGWTVGLGTASLVGVSLGILIVVAISQGMGPIEIIRTYLDANLSLSPHIYQTMGLPPDKAAEMKAYMELVRRAVFKVYPSLMVVGSALVVWLNVVLSIRLIRNRGIEAIDKREILMWKAPEGLVWGVILSGFSLFLPSGIIKFLSLNLLIIFMAVYLFQGMAIISFYLERFRAPTWIRIITYFFIAIQQLFLVLLALAGLFDQWINFRRGGRNES